MPHRSTQCYDELADCKRVRAPPSVAALMEVCHKLLVKRPSATNLPCSCTCTSTSPHLTSLLRAVSELFPPSAHDPHMIRTSLSPSNTSTHPTSTSAHHYSCVLALSYVSGRVVAQCAFLITAVGGCESLTLPTTHSHGYTTGTSRIR